MPIVTPWESKEFKMGGTGFESQLKGRAAETPQTEA